jgi:hypothetical protein
LAGGVGGAIGSLVGEGASSTVAGGCGVPSFPCPCATHPDNTPTAKTAEASLRHDLARTSISFKIRDMTFFQSDGKREHRQEATMPWDLPSICGNTLFIQICNDDGQTSFRRLSPAMRRVS